MKKGVLLTLDLLLAGFILTLFLFFVQNYYVENSFDAKLLQSFAKDALLFMDESLKNGNSTILEEDLENYLPWAIAYNLNVKYYDTNLHLTNEVLAGYDLKSGHSVTRRVFNYETGFGVANLRTWLSDDEISLNSIPLDLWEVIGDEPLPVDFSSGLNSSANTFGPYGANDGWDYSYDYYGTGSTCYYWNNATVSTDEKLIISIGDVNNGCNDDGNGDASYGIKFYINDTIADSLYVNISFDWVFDDHGLDTNDDGWIKARFGNAASMNYLGTNYGYGNDDSTNDIWYDNNPNDASGSFSQNVKYWISEEGWYYLDMGCKVRDWETNEWLSCEFDNVDVIWG